MSVACFTCTGTTEVVSPMTDYSYWNILRSLLLPDQNIEYVCFPDPKVHICIKCKEMLHRISEFRNVAVSSVGMQLEHWNQEMDPQRPTCTVKTEILDIKQELDEDPSSDMKSEHASLHEEIMLDTHVEDMCEMKTEPESLIYMEDHQEELVRRFLDNSTYCYGEGAVEEYSDARIQYETVSQEATDPQISRNNVAEASTSTINTRKRPRRCVKPAQDPADKMKTKYMKKTLNKSQLSIYRSQLENSEEFQKAQHKCWSCLVVFKKGTSKTIHEIFCHSKECRTKTKCVVCKQTMPAKLIKKHIASHFEVIECSACGYISKNKRSIKDHTCIPITRNTREKRERGCRRKAR